MSTLVNYGSPTTIQVLSPDPTGAGGLAIQNALVTILDALNAHLTATQQPHAVLVGPSTGTTAATPSFRTLVAADIPTISQSQVSGLTDALNGFAYMPDVASGNLVQGLYGAILSDSGISVNDVNNAIGLANSVGDMATKSSSSLTGDYTFDSGHVFLVGGAVIQATTPTNYYTVFSIYNTDANSQVFSATDNGDGHFAGILSVDSAVRTNTIWADSLYGYGGSTTSPVTLQTGLNLTRSLAAPNTSTEGVTIAQTYAQTGGTAANTDLKINRTGTTGSGAQLLIDAQVASTSKFKVDNAGTITVTNNGAKLRLQAQSDPTGYWTEIVQNYDATNPFYINVSGAKAINCTNTGNKFDNHVEVALQANTITAVRAMNTSDTTRPFLRAVNSAPSNDANLNTSEITPYLDETNNLLKFRVKYSNGTLKTASISLS